MDNTHPNNGPRRERNEDPTEGPVALGATDPGENVIPVDFASGRVSKPPREVSNALREQRQIFKGVASGPPFPTDCLPDKLRAFVEALAEYTQTVVTLPAMLVLAMLAAACQKCAVACPGWREPLSLFCLVVAATGERKSSVLREVVAPLQEFRNRWLADRDARLEDLKNRLDDASDDEARELQKQIKQLESDEPPRLFVDDVTPEALAQAVDAGNGRIAVLSAEADLLENAAGRYNRGDVNASVLLKGYSGDPIHIARVSKDRPIDVPSPAISFGLAVQPIVLERILGNEDFRKKGLLARCLLAVPTSNVGYRKCGSAAIPETIASAYRAMVLDLLSLQPTDNPQSLLLSAEAQEAFDTYAESIETELRPGKYFHGLEDWGNRLPGLVARLAAILHLAAHHDGHRVPEAPIPLEGIEKAISIGRWAASHAKLVLGQAEQHYRGARIVWEKLKEVVADRITKRQIFDKVKGQKVFPTVKSLDPALVVLEQLELISRLPPDPEAGPGRPSEAFDVYLDALETSG